METHSISWCMIPAIGPVHNVLEIIARKGAFVCKSIEIEHSLQNHLNTVDHISVCLGNEIVGSIAEVVHEHIFVKVPDTIFEKGLSIIPGKTLDKTSP